MGFRIFGCPGMEELTNQLLIYSPSFQLYVGAFVPHVRELSNQEAVELSLIYKLKPMICLIKTAFAQF